MAKILSFSPVSEKWLKLIGRDAILYLNDSERPLFVSIVGTQGRDIMIEVWGPTKEQNRTMVCPITNIKEVKKF